MRDSPPPRGQSREPLSWEQLREVGSFEGMREMDLWGWAVGTWGLRDLVLSPWAGAGLAGCRSELG